MSPAVTQPPQLITPGVIASELHEPLHRVLHVLATRQHIRPCARAGTLRLYDRRAVAMVRHELTAIDARRCRKVVMA
jgi:hypothetical protein